MRCDISSGCCFFTGPWLVSRSSLHMLRRVASLCRPLRLVLLLVLFPRSRSPVVGVLGLCWMWHGVPFARQRHPVVDILRLCWLLWGSFDCFCCPHTSAPRPPQAASLCFRVREPQVPCCARAPAVAHWARDPLGADEQWRCAAGAPVLVPWVPDPLRALVAAQDTSGAPVVAHWLQVALSVEGQIRCAVWGPGVGPLHPLRALTILRSSSGAQLAHWESDLPTPLWGQ